MITRTVLTWSVVALAAWTAGAYAGSLGTNCCEFGHGSGCEDAPTESCVCAIDSFCCDVDWDSVCVDLVDSSGCGTCITPLENDDCINATAINSQGDVAFDAQQATTDGPALPAVCDEGFGLNLNNDIWYCYTPAVSGDVTISLCGETFYDSRMAVYEGCACPPIDANLVACDDDGCGSLGGASVLNFSANANTGYLIRIGVFSAAPGSGVMTVALDGGGDPPLCGDLNTDGAVNLADFSTFASCFGELVTSPPPGCSFADAQASDLNDDGLVLLNDFSIFAGCYGG